MELTPASQDTAGPHSTQASGHSRNTTAKRVVVPQGTRIKDTDLLQTEESTYVDNYFTTRRYRHPYVTLDRSFRLFDWRLVDKYHTYGAILAVCLRIGIDPPDITKPEVCAKLEAWIDPFAEPPNAALARIAQNLYKQYEFLNQNLRCKLLTDPTIEDTKRSTVHMRRQAKGGRILFHYNGHGVPKPTANGDIWVFNSNYTQYMPVSVQDIQIWLGSPGVFVYDCSAAGNILEAFVKHAKRKDIEWLAAVSAQTERDILGIPSPSGGTSGTDSHSRSSSKAPGLASLPHSHSVHFAACRGDENLPMSPHLPADVFTACMTTPVEMAMRWWIMRHGQLTEFNQAAVTMVPGEVNNRRTPLGEINWIFTAITDTIAWNTLPKEAFKKLFRHDMLIANLFRNFMFASRVMRYYGCHPMSYPELPSTHDHPLWEAFEHALDDCLGQLPDFYSASQNQLHYEYMPSDFFTFQLDSFETYLSYGAPQNLHPELLPIILQVLLSQLHRNRALRLLAEFLRFGRWAVNECLAVGIFPYVLKLISSSQMNSRGYLAAIWHAIISVDYSVRYDLLRSNAPSYFVELLMDENPNLLDMTPVTVAACRVHCLMLLTHLCRDFPEAQQACGQLEVLFSHMVMLLEPTNSTPTRQWTCLLFSELGKNHTGNVHQAIQADLHEAIFPLLEDPVVEVRAAAVNALGAFFGPIAKTEHMVNIELIIGINLIGLAQDASPVVRKEVVIALSRYLKRYPEPFFTIAMESIQRRQQEAWLNVTGAKGGTGSRGTTGSPVAAGVRHKSTTSGSKRASLQSLSRQSSLRKPALSAAQASSYASRTAGQLNFPGSNPEDRASHHAVASPDVAKSLALAIAQRTVGSHTDSGSTSGMGMSGESHEDSSEANLSAGGHRGESDQVPNEAYLAIWRTILRMSSDPMAEIAQLACLLVDFVVHPLIMAITAINSQGWSHKGPTPNNNSTDSLHSVSSTPGGFSPRQRSVSSHYAPLVSPNWSGSYQSTTGGSPLESPRETVAGRPQHTSDASALEALSHAVGKYAHTSTTATPPELGDVANRPSMGSGDRSPRTTPPTPTKQRMMDS
ncbi:Target of rapamycin complex 1 subunit kog1, partial [Dispira simplex]